MGANNGVIEMLQAGLRAARLRQAVIAGNIANLHTPGFRRRTVEFEALLARALKTGRPAELAEVHPVVTQPRSTPVDDEGNDVDLETELGELIKNAGAYKTYLRLLAKLYQQTDLAIR